MIGILLDVSGSMKKAYALDSSHDARVERIHAILTTMMNIVTKEAIRHNRQESVFACAFGCQSTATCDLLSLLERIRHASDIPEYGHQALSDLATKHGAPHAENWIREYLSPDKAVALYRGLQFDRESIQEMIDIIPSKLTAQMVEGTTAMVSNAGSLYGGALEPMCGHVMKPFVEISKTTASDVNKASAYNSRAYKRAQQIIEDFNSNKLIGRVLERIQEFKLKSAQEVFEILDHLLQSKLPPGTRASASQSSLHDRIHKLLEPIKPYIYGRTPMCKALNDAKMVFRQTRATQKVLFLLSDGMSTDGLPGPIAEQLVDSGVTIVTCFLTSTHIDNPRRLLYEADSEWGSEDGRRVLFKMSSIMKNTHTPISYLVDANWELPLAGQSRLFIQANSLDVVNEFCEIVVSQMKEHCDALVHILEKVDLATYINQTNAEFEPKQQHGGTCYANAIAAVFHLAMSRIVGREGGVPDFYEIRDRIIREYGVQGANTFKVLTRVCSNYRLRFRKVKEAGARKAINERRPVVARFSLYDGQWEKFSAFYRMTPKRILRKCDLRGEF